MHSLHRTFRVVALIAFLFFTPTASAQQPHIGVTGYAIQSDYQFGTAAGNNIQSIDHLRANFTPDAPWGRINGELQWFTNFLTTTWKSSAKPNSIEEINRTHQFEDEALVLNSQHLGGSFTFGNIQSGAVITRETVFRPVIVEVLAKQPKGRAHWPSIWLYDYTSGNHTSDEIDILESQFNAPVGVRDDRRHVYQNIHGSATTLQNFKMDQNGRYNAGVDMSVGYHYYSVHWFSNGDIDYYVDGVRTVRRHIGWSGGPPNIIIYLSTGAESWNDWPGPIITNSGNGTDTFFPDDPNSTFKIRHIRIFKPGSGTDLDPNPNPPPGTPHPDFPPPTGTPPPPGFFSPPPGTPPPPGFPPPPPPDTEPPTAPTNLTASSPSPFRVVLSWDPSTDNVGVTGYNIYRDGTLIGVAGAQFTTYTDGIGLLPGKTYTYSVRARDVAGNLSAPATITTTTDPGADFVITAEPSSVQRGGSTTLRWNVASANVTECSAQSVPESSWTGDKSTSLGIHEETVSDLQLSTTFTLTCMGSTGFVSKSVKVTVIPPPKPLTCKTTAPAGVCQSSSASCIGVIRSGVNDCFAPTPVCCAPEAPPGSIPFVDLTGTPGAITAGSAPVTLTWAVSNASTCTASGAWSGTRSSTGGSVTIPGVTPPATFTLTCTGPTGITVEDIFNVLSKISHPDVPPAVGGDAGEEVEGGLVPCGTHATPPEGFAPGDQANKVAEDCQFADLIELIQRVMNYLLFAFAIPLAAIIFTYAGFLYLTAGGDTGKISRAHSIFLYVVVGLVVALAAWLIVKAIVTGLGVTIGEQFL
ncbi:family 16 glycosylhydrolase [bacterium]|nr:family 16 glycosylhydrolase [bacterium]